MIKVCMMIMIMVTKMMVIDNDDNDKYDEDVDYQTYLFSSR